MEGLLGVDLLRSLSGRLITFENSRKAGITSVDEKKIEALRDELTKDEQKLEEMEESLVELQNEERNLKDELKSLIDRMTAVGGGNADAATVKSLVEERAQLNNEQRNLLRSLEDMLATKLPFHLINKSLLDNYKQQIGGELNYCAWENDKRALEPRKIEFENAFFKASSPEILPELNKVQTSAIQTRFDNAWSSLFYPPPDDCADEIIHDYLLGNMRESVLRFFDKVALGKLDIHDNIKQQRDLAGRIGSLNRKIAKLEGIEQDGTLELLRKEVNNTSEKQESIGSEIRNIDRNIVGLKAKVNTQRAEFERENKKLVDSSPTRDLINKSNRVRNVLKEVIPELFPLKIKELATAMTDVYQDLAHKNQVGEIEISSDGSSSILSKSGKELTFDRSAGENQIFATALIAGLAKVSGVAAPMVVDTPLGRLDSEHRKNILKYWVNNKKRQVILLSQDEEISRDMYKKIKKNVSKTYLLTHVDVGEGVGRTIAKEDFYFNGGE